MSEQLIKFRAIAEENIDQYIDSQFCGKEFELNPVIITKEEEDHINSLENMTKENLQKKIFEALSLLDPTEEKLQEERFLKRVKRFSKAKYIEFYHSIVELHDTNTIEQIEEATENNQEVP